MANQAQLARPTRRMRPQTSAWVTLLIFFGIFCGLLSGVSYLAWDYYTTAMVPREGLVRVHAQSGIGYQAIGSAREVIPTGRCRDSDQVCVNNFREGERVKASPQAGYGPVLSVVLPDASPEPSQIDLYAHPHGADITLERYRVSRWNTRHQEVRIRHQAGYARYDLRGGQLFTTTSYVVVVGNGVTLDLAPGGSYSVLVPRDEEGQLVRQPGSNQDIPLLVEVAVRSGSAIIQSSAARAEVRPGQKVRVNMLGEVAAAEPAVWELIADGNFQRYKSAEYNRPDGTDTWSINASEGDQGMKPEEKNGIFQTLPRCPPVKVDFCDPQDYITIAQFRREGGQTRSFITGISQSLDVDVSEYTRSLVLRAWVRVLNQSVAMAGEQGSECPIMITLIYKETSPTDPEQFYRRCIYTGDEAKFKSPEIRYSRVAPYVWSHLDFELRDEPQLKAVRYLQKIRIEARGHDYLSEVTEVSLVGAQ